MPRPDECYQCRHLIQVNTRTGVQRADWEYEIGAAFVCGRRKCPLPTITKYDAPCGYFSAGERAITWREPDKEMQYEVLFRGYRGGER